MYSKCECMFDAPNSFLAQWIALFNGCERHGLVSEAVMLFKNIIGKLGEKLNVRNGLRNLKVKMDPDCCCIKMNPGLHQLSLPLSGSGKLYRSHIKKVIPMTPTTRRSASPMLLMSCVAQHM
ncbi:hypothetical protein SADUNF_Sadunf15G0019200 [Salix dunnii]|uniref:Uncharacterized protein n=1 Tax=Salix dunnii TaxID=1413687 RepID=A0A835MNE7_9ROSI|nr:hypothetical protein SADUNF_Sadunf15G0019200 [Salix dunnii]